MLLRNLPLLLVLASGCTDHEPDFYAFESNPSAGKGSKLLILFSDSPADADHIFVTISRVEAERADTGEFIALSDDVREFDLLELQNGNTAVLVDDEFPPGRYRAIRLTLLDQARLVFRDAEHALDLPRALTLPHFFDLDDQPTELIVDWNARTSIVRVGRTDGYAMHPQLTVVSAAESGSISGRVAGTDGTRVIVSAQQHGREVLSTIAETNGRYVLDPLRAGAYTLVVTASGFEYEVERGVAVAAEHVTPDRDFTLEPAAAGRVAGRAPPGTIVELRGDGHFLASTGVDPVTGEYVFDDFPAGDYDIVVRD
ncbi:MAG: DUF4382 domain-containing protein [Planctomycetota bacterium]